jgi:uncharacterized membrane protein YeaQ/YmgE (transglycosylase-associated protein family)
MPSILLSIPNLEFIPRNGGFLDTLFHKTALTLTILGFPHGGYTLTLIGLLIIGVLAFAVNGITERLTGRKVGSLATAVLVTIIGSAIAAAYVLLPFDFALEGVRIIAALLGAIVIAVFYSLLRGQSSKSGGGGH